MSSAVLFFIGIALISVTGTQSNEEKCSEGCFQLRNGTATSCDCCNNRGRLASPCELTDCQSGFECSLLYKSSVDMEDCKPGAVPLRANCRLPCEKEKPCNSPEIKLHEMDGCPTCGKPDDGFDNPCKKPNPCPRANDICTLHKVNCIMAPCYPVKRCCPKVDCPENCLKYTDEDGCQRCHCCNECVNHSCEEGKKCVLDVVYCKRCPCPPVPRCV